MEWFWSGFRKRASIIEDWQEESEEADAKAKEKKEPSLDIIRSLHSMPPDQYWRSWP